MAAHVGMLRSVEIPTRLASPPFDDDDFTGQVVETFEEVRPDKVPAIPEGDDSKLADGPLAEDEEPVRAVSDHMISSVVSQTVRVVPYPRVLKRGSVGKDVVALKRALARAGFLRWQRGFTTVMGPVAVAALKKFQRKNGIAPTGLYGKTTHSKLKRHYDRYGIFLLMQARVPEETTEQKQRRLQVATAMLGYHSRGLMHYTQTALRMQGVRERIRPPRAPNWEDCSSFSTWVCWVAGMPDPNGLGYNGQGYTGTLAAHGKRVVGPGEPGDLAFYGSGTFSHVVVLIPGGKIISHGQELGPLLFDSVHYRRDYAHTRSYHP